MKYINKLTGKIILSLGLCASLILMPCTTSLAERDYMQEWEDRKSLPIESNQIANWPEGPAIGAECAILMEMNTKTVLYAKNIHQQMYPASTTKILTCLLAMQNCTLDEEITFSHDAIYSVPLDGSRLGVVDVDDKLNMEHALYSVLVQSANEVANAVGEHVAEKLGMEKNISSFAEIMNQKAKELGCKNSHFANPSGLHDENHYTSAYDLALIGCEFFNNELLCKMSSTSSYHIAPNKNQTEDIWMSSKNQLFEGKPYEYEYLLGSKTGFVAASRQTLVSAAEKDGMKLVCVVFTEESPYQFEDTVSLFQYGFENFQRLSIDENETKYQLDSTDLFDIGDDLFGDSTPLLSLENDSYVILPNTANFSETQSTLNYNNKNATETDNIMATINYTFSDVPIGKCDITFSKTNTTQSMNFATSNPSAIVTTLQPESETTKKPNVIFINIKKVIFGIIIVAIISIIIMFIISTLNSYNFSPKGQSNKRRRKRRQENRIAKQHARQNARRQKKIQKRREKERAAKHKSIWRTH